VSSLESSIELHDSDILRIEKVAKQLNAKQRSVVSLDAFQREAKERFQDEGFLVDVKCYTTNVEGVYAFDIDITGRCEPVVFDVDRQRHEVVNDLLGIDPSRKGEIIKVTNSGPAKGKGFVIKDKPHSHSEDSHEH
jgi:hypothetical protein